MEIKIIIALIFLIKLSQFDSILTTCESLGFEDNWYYKNSSTKEQIVFEHSKKNDWVKFEGYYPRFSVEEIINLFDDYIITSFIDEANSKRKDSEMKFSTIDFYKEICDSLLEIAKRLDSIETDLADLQMTNEIVMNQTEKQK